MKSILFLIILTLIFSQTANSQSSWYWLQPLPTGATLNSVDFIDRNTGYTCGKAGTITKTTNGGLNWVLLGQITNSELKGIECLDLNTCITVGDSGVIYKTTNGGVNWVRLSSGVTGSLQDLDFINNVTGYASGVNGILLKTTNSGNNWTIVPFGVSSTLHSVSFISANKGAIGGLNNIYTTTNGGLNWTSYQGGTFFDYFETVEYVNDTTVIGLLISTSDYQILKSTNSGLSWERYRIEFLEATGEIPRWMSFNNEQKGYIVTNYGNVGKTTNGGVNWNRDTSFKPAFPYGNVFYQVNAVDTSHAYAIGTGGLVIKTSNSGEFWEKQIGTIQDYSDIFFTNESTGYVTGKGGYMIKTTDAGMSWNQIDLNTTFGLNKVFFVNLNTGYVCGDSGLVKKTTNAGENWTDLFTPTNDTSILTMYFINQNSGFLASDNGSIYKTLNGGINWFRVFTLTGTGTPVIYDFDFLDTSRGVAAASNRILLTANSGNNWNVITSNGFSLLTADYLDSLNLILGGYSSRLIKSTNGGLNWFNLNITHGVFSMQFQDSEYGIACGENGYISRTTNGGLIWTLQQRVATEDLNSIFFINTNTGYSVGMTGQILKTTNGGLSFINFSGNFIFDDYRLYQNYPNPFNPTTQIKFELKTAGKITLKIYDISGREVRRLLSDYRQPGEYSETFDAGQLSSGVYFYSLYQDGVLADTRKCLLVK